MSSASDQYVARFEKFLDDLGASGEYFCSRQYDRWLGQVRRAFEDAEVSTVERKPAVTSNRPAEEQKSSRR